MSIIETLYVLFKGDSTDVKKAAKESEKAVDDLSGKINTTFEKTDKVTAKVNKSFYDLAKSAVAFVGATSAAYTVFYKTIEASNFAGELGNVSKALGVNVGDLDAWGQAVQRTGGSAAGFQQSLKALGQHFGISAGMALKALPQLASVFQRLGNFRAQYYGKLLGLDEATILLLQQGRREVEAIINRQKELGVVTEKDVEISNKFKIANLELSLAFRSLYLTIAQDIIPVFTKAYHAILPFVDYLKAHKDLVIGTLIGIAVVVTVMAGAFVVANIALFATIAAVTALIGVFAIAFEDIKAYIEGNQSLTGDLLKRWTNVKDLFSDILEIMKKIFSFSAVPALSGVISVAQKALGYVNSNGAAMTAGASQFLNKSFANNANINVESVVINTQATDANGIAANFMDELIKQHTWQATNNFSDGVQY